VSPCSLACAMRKSSCPLPAFITQRDRHRAYHLFIDRCNRCIARSCRPLSLGRALAVSQGSRGASLSRTQASMATRGFGTLQSLSSEDYALIIRQPSVPAILGRRQRPGKEWRTPSKSSTVGPMSSSVPQRVACLAQYLVRRRKRNLRQYGRRRERIGNGPSCPKRGLTRHWRMPGFHTIARSAS